MFTGLIECMGTVVSVEYKGTSVFLGIKPDADNYTVPVGGSVAIDGACLTVERNAGSVLHFAAVRETLQRTTLSTVTPGRRVNCERALQVGGRLDGHMVQGHIDGTGFIEHDQDVGGSLLRTFKVPAELSRFMPEKGSVAIDGISLTIATAETDRITVSLIPISLKKTTMFTKKRGDLVNLECDVLARYLDNLLRGPQEKSHPEAKNSLLNSLERLGF